MSDTQTHTPEAGDVTTLREAINGSGIFGEGGQGKITIRDLAYTAFMRGRSGENADDGGPCDWFNDTLPLVLKGVEKLRGYVEDAALASSPAPRAPAAPGLPEETQTIEATQVTLGEGLVDITVIRHEGRAGVLFRPRTEHIPFGDVGELQEGSYWPVSSDVVLWVSGEGPQVTIDALRTLAAAPAAPPDDGGTGTDALVDRFADALKARLRLSKDKPGRGAAWASPEWRAICQHELLRHISKGDPLDVTAYAAFCWHHGWSTAADGGTDGLRAYVNKIIAGHPGLETPEDHVGWLNAGLCEIDRRLAALSSRTPAGAADDPVGENSGHRYIRDVREGLRNTDPASHPELAKDLMLSAADLVERATRPASPAPASDRVAECDNPESPLYTPDEPASPASAASAGGQEANPTSAARRAASEVAAKHGPEFRTAIKTALAPAASAGGAEVAPEGTWLWGQLMDFCRKRRFPPAEFNDLFEIVIRSRALAPAARLVPAGRKAWIARAAEVLCACEIEQEIDLAQHGVQQAHIDAATAIYDAARPVADPDAGWKPIETLPFGRQVLLGGWTKGFWLTTVFVAADENWRESFDWIEDEPTHWMLVPAPAAQPAPASTEGR